MRGGVYQTIGKYELRSTYRFDNAIWPQRYWHLPIYASKNDVMEGGQAWMKCLSLNGDSCALWIGTFAHSVNASDVAENDSLGWLYKFPLSENGNLIDPASWRENMVSGTQSNYAKAWRMPTYFEETRAAQLSNINGGVLIRENDQTYWVLAEGFGEKMNFLRKYPFDEATGFRNSVAYLPIPAGTKEIDLLDASRIISFSVSGCNYLQHKNATYPWRTVCFPFIFSLPLDEFEQN